MRRMKRVWRGSYYSKHEKNLDYWLNQIRFWPEFLPTEVVRSFEIIENSYRKGLYNQIRAKHAIFRLRAKLYPYRFYYWFIDDKHLIILPTSETYLIDQLLKRPNTLCIVGESYAGKTITSWKAGLDMLKRVRNSTMYVYGDVDGIGNAILDTGVIDEKKIKIKEDYSPPPVDGKKKIILYNELAEKLMGEETTTTEGKEMKLQAMRRRHLNAWIIYNAMRVGTLASALRDTSQLFLFKWLYGFLLGHTIKLAPPGLNELIKMTPRLGHNEGIAVVPKLEKGGTFFVHLTNPPKWLLEIVQRKAKKNIRLLMSESEREAKIMERIAQLKMDPNKKYTWEEIQEKIYQEFKVNYVIRTLQKKYKKWKQMIGFV